MKNKINIAFIKYGGLSAGGSERWLQYIAGNLDKNLFNIDYFYCDASPYLGSDYKHPDTDKNRLDYLRSKNINLIKFNVTYKDIRHPYHIWKKTNFWEKFKVQNYNFVQTVKAGHKEYPYYKIKLPIIEYVTLDAGIDRSSNIYHSFHLSNWQRNKWIQNKGIKEKSSVVHIPAFKHTNENLRKELSIEDNAIILGFHQRNDDNIFSKIPLNVFKDIFCENLYFILLGGSSKYREQAKKLNLKNIIFLQHNSDEKYISKFLNTLDIYTHGRFDGETFGTCIAEAMMHSLPCVSHFSNIANGHIETIKDGGKVVESISEYCDYVNLLISNPTYMQSIGKKASQIAYENYDLKSVINKIENFYIQNIDNIDIFKKKLDKSFYYNDFYSNLKTYFSYSLRKLSWKK